MKVLLTGALGNVGSHTWPQLVQRGHEVRCLVRPPSRERAGRLPSVAWGDLTDADAVAQAVAGVEVVIHLAGVIPPLADEDPELARRTNVDGTRNVIEACLAQATPPKLLFSSTLDVHGFTLDKTPPRQVTDPMVATNPYTEHKIACEEMIRASGLTHAIFRFADVPVLGMRKAHPIMFDIGLDNRIECIHADDLGLALTNALETPEVWGRVLFIGGGESCQLTYREYLTRLLGVMGVDPLPDNAFSKAVYATDWLDTTESQQLLKYQRYQFDDISAAILASLGWRKHLMRLARPVIGPMARRAILRMSPHYRSAV